MRKGKGFVGFLAFVFFIASIVALVMGLPGWAVIGLILLHSLCLMLMAFMYSLERADYTATEELQKELSDLKADRENEKTTMQRALDAREIELNDKTEELKRLKSEAEANEQKLATLKAAVHSAEEQLEEAKNDINEFLPPVNDPPIMVDIIKVAREASDELGEAARKVGLSIRISSTEEQLYVKAQAERLLILFRNIIDNSIKYMNRAGSLVITISRVEDDIFIVLKDTGAGLKEDETKHIFELNYQGSNRISGNGLGLTQAKAIVDYYGGTIYGKSMPDMGMGIYIQLPASRKMKEAEE